MPASYAPATAMPKPISVSALGVSPVRMKTLATGASMRARKLVAERGAA